MMRELWFLLSNSICHSHGNDSCAVKATQSNTPNTYTIQTNTTTLHERKSNQYISKKYLYNSKPILQNLTQYSYKSNRYLYKPNKCYLIHINMYIQSNTVKYVVCTNENNGHIMKQYKKGPQYQWTMCAP